MLPSACTEAPVNQGGLTWLVLGIMHENILFQGYEYQQFAI